MGNLRCFLIMFMLLFGAAAVHAAEPYKNITCQELKALLDRHEPGLVVIDTRGAAEFKEAHIIGAVNIPLNDMATNPALLNYPKNEKIVFYCNGLS